MVLDMQVSSSKQHTSAHANSALARLLDELGAGPVGRRPALVRGDSGHGNDGILMELVLPCGQRDGAHGGHHEPAAAAGSAGPGRAQRRADTAVPDVSPT